MSGSLSEKDIWNYISESKEQIQKNRLDFSNFWYFEPGEDTEENIKLLLEKGFTGYSQITTYGKTLISGEEKNGMFYIEYVPVKQGDNKIKSTLELCKQQNNAASASRLLIGVRKTMNGAYRHRYAPFFNPKCAPPLGSPSRRAV